MTRRASSVGPLTNGDKLVNNITVMGVGSMAKLEGGDLVAGAYTRPLSAWREQSDKI
jgi:hypothetical protein